MSYPIATSGKTLISGIALLLLVTLRAEANNRFENALYIRDTALTAGHSGVIRNEKNGDIVIALPADALGRYRIRFFDGKNVLLFEIRQIRDPLLIIEKYNFGHAGLFQYELYRDNGLVEKASFRINP